MIPTAFVALKALPMNTSGKLDRRALPAPDWSSAEPDREYVAPRTPEEQLLAQTWGELLHVERVGVHDDFFALGGHSLLAIQAMLRLNAALGLNLALREPFEAPTIAALAERVLAARASGRLSDLPPIRPVGRDAPLPVSYNQEPFWVTSQLEEGAAPYVFYRAARLKGPLDVPALQQALNELVRRHESLRTTFADGDDNLVQVIAAYQPRQLQVVDLSGLPAEQREAEVRRHREAESRQPIDLTEGPLMRMRLLRLGAEEHVVLVGMHHIIYDGWSMEVLSRELLTAYVAFAAGLPSPLDELPIQYADFAVWQRERLQGEVLDRLRRYWLKQLEGLPTLELPTDRPRPAVRTTHGALCEHRLPGELNQAIQRLSNEEGVTKFMTLLAAFQTLLCHYSGQHDFGVSTPVAGRLRPETENVIGCFINDLVLRRSLR